MVLQVQLLCTASFAYFSSFQNLASNLQSSLSPSHYPSIKSASLHISNSSAHMNKNCRRICADSRAAPFNKEAYEVERLRLDARAREAMKAQEQTEKEDNSKAWKWEIRKRIWDLMERENIAQNPRPVHHRIPNFVGATAAAQLLTSLEAFATAQCVKVNPDTPQKQLRYFTLSGGKRLLTPQPRLRTGFFSILDSTTFPQGAMHEACTSAGVAKHGKPIGLDAKIKVDLIVIGSVAVDPRTGARLGKGESSKHVRIHEGNRTMLNMGRFGLILLINDMGFAELEYGMLRYMGAIDDSTLIVTSVHDKQLVESIPVDKLLIHDVPVDVICTPTQIIHTNTTIPKPKGIYWDKLSPEKLGQIKILWELKKHIEEETGQPLPCGPSEKLPPTAERRSRRQG